MHSFDYNKADTVGAALSLRAGFNAGAFVAGGTNIIDLMKENVAKPDGLTDINHVEELKNISEKDGGLRLGALVTNADTAYHPEIERRYPLLSKAILAGASPQLRNMATNGGNLMQRTRCFYFYDITTPCNKREPGTGCSAIGGHNRINAVLGTSEHCIAVYPSDMSVALAALEATVNVESLSARRQIAFEDFHRLPGDTPHLDNNLQPDEIITSIDLPKKGFEKNFAYLKLRDRASYAFALVSVATAFEMEGQLIKTARIALGGLAHKPWRVKEAEIFLADKIAADVNFATAADMILKGAKGFGENNFKPELAKRAIIRNCQTAAKGEDKLWI